MRLRIFLLALGFAARTSFEKEAQKAMHRFHRVILPSLVLDFLIFETLFVLCAAIPVFWIGGSERVLSSSVVLAATLGACVFFGAVAGRLWWREGDASFQKSLILHEGCSGEVALLCRAVGLPAVRVFYPGQAVHLDANAAAVSLVNGERGIVVTAGALFLSAEERKGIFAHELAHFLIPLGHEEPLFFKERAHHACEFAADAIGASILNDPTPILIFLRRCILRRFLLGDAGSISKDSTTHPALLERIERLVQMRLLNNETIDSTRR